MQQEQQHYKQDYSNHFHDGEDYDPDYLLFGWAEFPLGGMDDFIQVFTTPEEALQHATELAQNLEIIQYQIVDGVTLEVIDSGSAKDLAPLVIN